MRQLLYLQRLQEGEPRAKSAPHLRIDTKDKLC
jgi:hypothetical protein